jgi:RNA polymerase-binding transcription factor DksA
MKRSDDPGRSTLHLPLPQTDKSQAGFRRASHQDRTCDLHRIDAALRRLENGRFGHCLYCGDQISFRRLNHDPAIESCSTCNEG